MFNLIFPFKMHLNILQLEEYKPMRYIKWNLKNITKRKVDTKKGLVYTSKVKNIIIIYFLILLISLLIHPLLLVLLLLEPFIGLTIAVILLKPYEIWNRYKTKKQTFQKIKSFKNLKVIGITGSFGKSSTKEILYQLIRNRFKVLKTPESFNTVFGVAKVVDLELDNYYEYFICEMAAYKIGEIKELCQMVPPDYAILTGITTQHFERFGSLENTIKAKFELPEATKDKAKIVFNFDDANVRKGIEQRNIKNPSGFLQTRNISFNKNGSSFEIEINNKFYKVQTILFGFANIKNISAAAAMGQKLGLTAKEITDAIKNLKPVDNRLVLTSFGKGVLLNNTYSSNPQGFKETLSTAKLVNGKKVLVTPGLVELGNIESEVHKELGILSQGIFDEVILVGQNNRTKSFAKGLSKSDKYEFIKDNRNEYFEKIEELKKTYDWIFLENDVTENY